MALFENVEAPYTTLVPGATPADATTGNMRLFVDVADGLFKMVDDAGTVTSVGSSIADILDLTTAETDDSLVLAPDGAGGVEFRAEAGGGGGGGLPAYIGTTGVGGTAASWHTAARTVYVKKITLASTTAIYAIGMYLDTNAVSATIPVVAIYDDNGAGATPGSVLAVNSFVGYSSGGLVAMDGGWLDLPIAALLPTGDYWFGMGMFQNGTDVRSWSDVGSDGYMETPYDGHIADQAVIGGYTSTSRDYSLRVLAAS